MPRLPQRLRRYLDGDAVDDGPVSNGVHIVGGLLKADDPIRTAVIGCGRHSRSALQPNLCLLPTFAYITACDLDVRLARESQRRFGAQHARTDLEATIANDDIEAVIIAAPPRAQYEAALVCARRGMHIFVEKPIAASSEDAQVLASCLQGTRAVGMTGTMSRHVPAIALARERIARRGPIVGYTATFAAPGPRSDQYWQLGSIEHAFILGQAIHVIDSMRFLAGDVHSIAARASALNGGRRIFTVSVQFASGALGSLILGSTTDHLVMDSQVFLGSGEVLRLDRNRTIKLLGSSEFRALPGYAETSSSVWEQEYTYGGILRRGYVEELWRFAQAIRGGEDTVSSIADGVETIRVCEAVLRSAASSGTLVTL